MPRADPAYLQYLERQSMLAKSSEMAKVVSGSELAWRASATSGSPAAMLDYADTWLLVHPLTLLTSSRSSGFDQLSASSSWPVYREAGIRGLYVAPVQGGGALWAKDRQGQDIGDDVVQYEFSRAAGKDSSYGRLMSSVIDNKALMGSDIVPAATGLGPDFFLAARNVREYPGIYCMVEIPQTAWEHLPEVASEWSGAALGQAQIDALNSKGLLPKAMRDETSPLGRAGGWAATGVIRGVDGNNYRWVYRYYGSPEYAVLNWEDPSQAAHRILSGSAVRQVGMQGQALLGMRFEAFQGLEAAPEGSHSNVFSVEPALTAAQSMSRELRRYGGWSWLRDDDLPLNSMRDFLSFGADFIYDSVFSPSAEHALLTGDASLARFMADEALRLNIDFRRLVHVMPAQEGVNYSLPHLTSLGTSGSGEKALSFRNRIQSAMRAVANRLSPAPVADNHLYATGPGIAALALGLTSEAEANNKVTDIERGHGLLIFFKAMQPGVLMLAGQDLAGVLPVQFGGAAAASGSFNPAYSSRGGYGLTSSSSALAISTQGTPRAPQIYAPPDVQVHKKGSFISRIGSFIRARTDLGVAKGTLIARPGTKGQGSIALITRLEDGNSYLLAVSNFSREAVTETISLDEAGVKGPFSRITALGTGGSHNVAGRKVTVSLGPWQGRALVLHGGSSKGQAAVTAQAEEEATPIPGGEAPEARPGAGKAAPQTVLPSNGIAWPEAYAWPPATAQAQARTDENAAPDTASRPSRESRRSAPESTAPGAAPSVTAAPKAAPASDAGAPKTAPVPEAEPPKAASAPELAAPKSAPAPENTATADRSAPESASSATASPEAAADPWTPTPRTAPTDGSPGPRAISKPTADSPAPAPEATDKAGQGSSFSGAVINNTADPWTPTPRTAPANGAPGPRAVPKNENSAADHAAPASGNNTAKEAPLSGSLVTNTIANAWAPTPGTAPAFPPPGLRTGAGLVTEAAHPPLAPASGPVNRGPRGAVYSGVVDPRVTTF